MQSFPTLVPHRGSGIRCIGSQCTASRLLCRSQTIRRGFRISLLAASMALAGCLPRPDPDQPVAEPGEVQDPCVQTRDGCVPEPEYLAEVESVAEDTGSLSIFEDLWSRRQINVPEAWAHLWTARGVDRPGLGVTVGVLDTGIDLLHPDFAAAVEEGKMTEEFFLGAVDETGEEFSHGTAVAGVIVSRRHPRQRWQSTGIAPYATLKAFAIPLGDPPPPNFPFSPISLDVLAQYDQEDAEFYRGLFSRDLDILNLSFGVQGLSENYGDIPALRASIPETIEALAQTDREDRTILVWAAGNAHERLCRPGTNNCEGDSETDHLDRPAGILNASSPSLYSGMMAYLEELQAHSIAVAATDADGEIAFFSNRCGIAADWCIAAPGFRVWAPYLGPFGDGEPGRGWARPSGTSFAAPMVSGGLALVKQFFRDQLSSEELVARLFQTANDSGRYEDSSIYGHGLMDLGAATSPVGETTVATGDQVHGPGTALGGTGLQVGQAFGDGFVLSLTGQEIAAFDSLGSPFWYDVAGLTSVPEAASLSARLRDFQRAPVLAPGQSASNAVRIPLLAPTAGSAAPSLPLRLAISGTSAAETASHLAFRGRSLLATLPVSTGLTATVVTTEGVDGQDPASGAALSWQKPGALLGVRAGWMGERQSLLGSDPDGAFGSLASNALFTGIEANGEFGAWQLRATAEAGSVNPQSRGGLFRSVSNIATSGFALRATRQVAEQRVFRVSLSQPLRVERGRALLNLPSGRTKTGEVVRSALDADLEPSGRQIDLAFEWQQPANIGLLRLGATVSHQPGHRRDAEPELILLSGWRFAF